MEKKNLICSRCGTKFSGFRITLCGNCKNIPKVIPGMKYTRELVRARDGYRCQGCGKKKKKNGYRLDVHHLNGKCGKLTKYYDKVKDMPGLITLCHKCHMNRHDFSIKRSFCKKCQGIID